VYNVGHYDFSFQCQKNLDTLYIRRCCEVYHCMTCWRVFLKSNCKTPKGDYVKASRFGHCSLLSPPSEGVHTSGQIQPCAPWPSNDYRVKNLPDSRSEEWYPPTKIIFLKGHLILLFLLVVASARRRYLYSLSRLFIHRFTMYGLIVRRASDICSVIGICCHCRGW